MVNHSMNNNMSILHRRKDFVSLAVNDQKVLIDVGIASPWMVRSTGAQINFVGKSALLRTDFHQMCKVTARAITYLSIGKRFFPDLFI